MRKKPRSKAGKAGMVAVNLPGISAPFLRLRRRGPSRASMAAPGSSLRRPERPWERALGLVLQRLLVRADEAGGDDCADHGDYEGGDPDGPRIMLEGAAEQVAAHAEDRRPDDSARRIEEE